MTLQHPNGRTYPLDFDICDRHTGHFTWAVEVPNCPNCHSPLLKIDGLEKEVTVEPRYAQSELVTCDECGWHGETR